jgi:hypothetical protein
MRSPGLSTQVEPQGYKFLGVKKDFLGMKNKFLGVKNIFLGMKT